MDRPIALKQSDLDHPSVVELDLEVVRLRVSVTKFVCDPFRISHNRLHLSSMNRSARGNDLATSVNQKHESGHAYLHKKLTTIQNKVNQFISQPVFATSIFLFFKLNSFPSDINTILPLLHVSYAGILSLFKVSNVSL